MNYNLTAAVIGSGYIGKRHIAAYKSLGLDIVICSNDVETGKKLADEYNTKFYEDYNEMFKKEKLDVVSVCLPTFLHYQATMAALDNNINVICEKPFTFSSDEAKEMIKKAKEKELLLMVGHCVRFMQPYEYLKRCVNDLRFGKLVFLNLFRLGSMPAWSVNNWFADAKLSGGALRDLHVHDTDIVLNVLGMPKDVYTTGTHFACNTVYDFDCENLSVTASVAWRNIKNAPGKVGFDAIFEKGSIMFSNGVLGVYTPEGEVEKPLENEMFGEFFAPIGEDAIKYEIKYFCHCVVNKVYPEICPNTESLNTVIINEKETDSIKK